MGEKELRRTLLITRNTMLLVAALHHARLGIHGQVVIVVADEVEQAGLHRPLGSRGNVGHHQFPLLRVGQLWTRW